MTKKRKITWTEIQREVKTLLEQGKTRKELLAAGYTASTVDRVRNAMKELKKEQRRENPPPSIPSPEGKPRLKEHVYDLVELGGIYAEPADWRITQRGVFLILNTHEDAKMKLGYEGTVGEFICDCVQLMRQLIGVGMMQFDYFLQEDNNGRYEEGTSSGEEGIEQGADDGYEQS